MTADEYKAETTRLKSLITRRKNQMRNSNKSLAEKIEMKRQIGALEATLLAHRLHRFELITD